MGIFGHSPAKFKNQDYDKLRKTAQDSGHPFIDQEFPPDDKALFYSGSSKVAGIEWRRPKDICSDPHLFVEGASAHDLIQGEMGNCWMVAACSCVAIHKDIWSRIIPDHRDQEWDEQHPEKYSGIFRFRFWRYSEWVEVVVDDLLPTRNGKLVFCHSKDKNEFWSALLEKAYAKLFGSYEALDGGELAEGLEDFTGGVSEPVDIEAGGYAADVTKRDELFSVLKKGWDHNALMAAAIPAKSSAEMEKSTECGLVVGHAYGITAVKRVPLEGTGFLGIFNQSKLDMVRLRNPWGGTEWNGPFSDGSEEWAKISKSDREKLGLTFEDDGEFWMQFNDFCKYFPSMCVCRVVNTRLFSLSKTWNESVMHSDWKAPNRNGGCLNNAETFLKNPQFRFDVHPKEDECLFSLTQKSSRGNTNDTKLTIGFTILRVEVNREYRLHTSDQIVKSSDFRNSRSIFLRHTLTKGRYAVVLCTFEPGHNADFMFRMYTDESHNGKEMIYEVPQKNCCMSLCCCLPMCKVPTLATRIKVMRAMGLERQDTVGGADPYVYIVCEREKVRSEVVKDSLNPEWNFSAVFYRARAVQKPIKIQIWNNNLIRDECMGQALLQATEDMKDKAIELDLYDHKEPNRKRPGKMWIVVSSNRDMTKI